MRGATAAGSGLLGAIAMLAITSGLSPVQGQVVPSMGHTQASGKILSVDLAKKSLKVEVEKPAGTATPTQPMDFALTDQTRVTKEGQPAQGLSCKPASGRPGAGSGSSAKPRTAPRSR